jgi:hypothetical protein
VSLFVLTFGLLSPQLQSHTRPTTIKKFRFIISCFNSDVDILFELASPTMLTFFLLTEAIDEHRGGGLIKAHTAA